MATIGRDRAVAHLGRLNFSGYVARMLWAVVHIALLGGARNRFMVLREKFAGTPYAEHFAARES